MASSSSLSSLLSSASVVLTKRTCSTTSVVSVLSGYRRLFRARKFLFVGDEHALRESKIAIRAEFIKNRHVSDTHQLNELIKGIGEAEDMLLHGFTRGQFNPTTNRYEIKIQPEHMSKDSSNKHINVEPVTQEMAADSPKVQVTKSTKRL